VSLNFNPRRKSGLVQRAVRWVAAIALILVGLVLSLPLVPGPGFLLVIFGVLVLLPESRWLQRKYVRLKRSYPRLFKPIERRFLRRDPARRARARRAVRRAA
jgi:hypothetical protein